MTLSSRLSMTSTRPTGVPLDWILLFPEFTYPFITSSELE
jgi:hypothetical protein